MTNVHPKPQQHPREGQDRLIVERLLQEEMSDYNLAELARLLIRYNGFPGADSLKELLAQVLQKWNLTEADLFARTRAIHARGGIYKPETTKREDWT